MVGGGGREDDNNRRFFLQSKMLLRITGCVVRERVRGEKGELLFCFVFVFFFGGGGEMTLGTDVISPFLFCLLLFR